MIRAFTFAGILNACWMYRIIGAAPRLSGPARFTVATSYEGSGPVACRIPCAPADTQPGNNKTTLHQPPRTIDPFTPKYLGNINLPLLVVN
jgi:hypothetical protein